MFLSKKNPSRPEFPELIKIEKIQNDGVEASTIDDGKGEEYNYISIFLTIEELYKYYTIIRPAFVLSLKQIKGRTDDSALILTVSKYKNQEDEKKIDQGFILTPISLYFADKNKSPIDIDCNSYIKPFNFYNVNIDGSPKPTVDYDNIYTWYLYYTDFNNLIKVDNKILDQILEIAKEFYNYADFSTKMNILRSERLLERCLVQACYQLGHIIVVKPKTLELLKSSATSNVIDKTLRDIKTSLFSVNTNINTYLNFIKADLMNIDLRSIFITPYSLQYDINKFKKDNPLYNLVILRSLCKDESSKLKFLINILIYTSIPVEFRSEQDTGMSDDEIRKFLRRK